MRVLWQEMGGDAVYLQYKLSNLLCRYRSTVLLGCEDTRLKEFLQRHWTTEVRREEDVCIVRSSCPGALHIPFLIELFPPTTSQ